MRVEHGDEGQRGRAHLPALPAFPALSALSASSGAATAVTTVSPRTTSLSRLSPRDRGASAIGGPAQYLGRGAPLSTLACEFRLQASYAVNKTKHHRNEHGETLNARNPLLNGFFRLGKGSTFETLAEKLA